jgi:hypothetical protein
VSVGESVRRAGTVPILCGIGLALAGCASDTATVPNPPAAHPARPTATATVRVAFAVDVTPIPTVAKRHAAPHPVATRFKAPPGPYLQLMPRSGPPVSRTIHLRGGNLPKITEVTVTWGAARQASPLTTTVWTGPHGVFTTNFVVPGAAPGVYVLRVEINGVVMASAVYTVESRAMLAAAATPDAAGDRVAVTGRRFVPNTRLLVVAYLLLHPKKAVILGRPRTDARGGLSFSVSTAKLAPGQYVLRAYTVSAIAAQMAETYFQVVA